MKTCPRCGVDFEENLTICPLCLYSETGSAENSESIEPEAADLRTLTGYGRLSKRQKRKLFWEISVIVLLSGILVTMIIDLISTGLISWSKYTITACLLLFVNITLFSFLRHKLLLLLCGSFITTSLLIILLDIYSNKMGWGTQLGVPLLLSLYLAIYLIAILFRKNSQHGFNMLGYIFMATGLLSMWIELCVSRYFQGRIKLSWSLIVMVCMLVIAGILMYFHHRLKKGAELRRFFHI